MYLFELQDILFTIKSINIRHQPFNLISLITSTSILLVLDQVPTTNVSPYHLNNTYRHSPIVISLECYACFGLNMYFGTLKSKLKSICGNTFDHFDDDNNCTLHYLCQCSECHQSRPPTIDLNHLQYLYIYLQVANIVVCNYTYAVDTGYLQSFGVCAS